jgi:hypothetical protein
MITIITNITGKMISQGNPFSCFFRRLALISLVMVRVQVLGSETRTSSDMKYYPVRSKSRSGIIIELCFQQGRRKTQLIIEPSK